MARDCPIGVEVFLLLFLLHFPKPRQLCVVLVCVCFFRAFFEHWCVCGTSCFVPKYY